MSRVIWKPVKDFTGIYEVSNHGQVRSLTRVIKNGLNTTRLIKGQNLKLKIDNNGYPVVSLNKEHKAKTKRVHRLVCEAFLENPSNLSDVNHKDGNKKNNHISNLEWCSRSYNIEHAYRKKLRTDAKFSPSQVRSIRNSNKSQSFLAKEYQVDQNTIKQIITKRTYKWVN